VRATRPAHLILPDLIILIILGEEYVMKLLIMQFDTGTLQRLVILCSVLPRWALHTDFTELVTQPPPTNRQVAIGPF
jgi:hypothetical protein